MRCLTCIHRVGNDTTREIWYTRDGYSFKLKPGEHYCKNGYFNSRAPRMIPERVRERKLTAAKIETMTLLAAVRAMRAELVKKYGMYFISGASLEDRREFIKLRKQLSRATRRETMIQKEVEENGKV